MTETTALKPLVEWGQDRQHIFLKFDLKDVSEENLNIDYDEDQVVFEAVGAGVHGHNIYKCEIEFYHPINPQQVSKKVTPRHIQLTLAKTSDGEIWPRLTYEKQKFPWLKIDFDHFLFEEDTDSDNGTSANDGAASYPETDQILRNIQHQLTSHSNEGGADVKRIYLVLYNMFQWIGFCYVFIALAVRYFRHGEGSKKKAYEIVGSQLKICQLMAVLEVLHPLLGIVKTSPLMPLMQVVGRNLALFMLIAHEPKLQGHEVVWWLFLVWSAVELVRYPFYALAAMQQEWRLVTWLRYTVWIPLYPLGFMFEGFLMLLALPYFEKSGRWSVSMPNYANVAFHFPTFLRIYMILFLFGMWFLMRRMYQQRKHKLKAKRL